MAQNHALPFQIAPIVKPLPPDVATPTVPDPASTHVKYAGNLADDDFMWIVECTIEEFHKLLASPLDWVNGLGKHPDWQFAGGSTPAPPPVLLRHFTMRIQQRRHDAASDLITIQGVSNTGIVFVRASHASAVAGVRNLRFFREMALQAAVLNGTEDEAIAPEEVLNSFWDEIAFDPNNAPTYKKPYAVNVDLEDGRYYGHFEICRAEDGDPREQAARSAAFILAVGSDPKGYAAMLNGLDQTTLYVGGVGVSSGPAIQMVANPNPDILYTALDDETVSSCNLITGAYVAATPTLPAKGDVDNPIVKMYGVGNLTERPDPAVSAVP